MNDVPPNDLVSERSVIGSGFFDAECIDVATGAGLLPHHFYSDLNGEVFNIQQRLRADGTLVAGSDELDIQRNHEAIMTELRRVKVLGLTIGEQVTGGLSEFVAEFTTNVPYQYQLVYYVGRVLETARQRSVLATLDNLRREALLADPNDIAERLTRAADGIRDGLTPRNPIPAFRTLTSAELDAADLQTEYLVDDVLARHQSTIIAAAKKSLKTNIAIDLTLSLASRCPFLGKFYIPVAVRVALMSGESGDAVIQETAKRIARSKLWPNLADYENAVWSFDLPRLGQPQTKRELIKFIRDHALDVLIIDPAYLCLDLGDDAGNLFSVGKKLRELTDIQHETGCTIIIVHHNKKTTGDPFAVPELESIAWSGFQEWARQWLLIGRREKYNPEAVGSHRLWLSAGGSAGHSGLWAVDIEEGSRSDQGGRRWDVAIETASTAIAASIEQNETAKEQQAQAKAERQLAADAEKLLNEYRKRPEGDTEKYFRERIRLNGARTGAANDKLHKDGQIEPCDVVKNGRTYPGFRAVVGASGLTGTDRDSTGSSPACPDGEHGAGLNPVRGSPGPAHRDSEDSLIEDVSEPSPVDHDQVAELFPVGAA